MASISKQSKEMQDRHRKMLVELLKRPENQECMDCRARNPTWASINLGVFLCIRCSGLHRQVGVHITKVRSCTMDLWEPEQIAFMQTMGNGRGKAMFEALLPPDYGKPSENEDSQLVLQWIRTKYEKKRYFSATPVAVDAPARPKPHEPLVHREPKPKRSKETKDKPVKQEGNTAAATPVVASTSTPVNFTTTEEHSSPMEYTFDQFMSPSVQSPRQQLSPSFETAGATSAFGFLGGNDGGAAESPASLASPSSAFSFLNPSSTPAVINVDGAIDTTAPSSAFTFIAESSSSPAVTETAVKSSVPLPADSLLVFDPPTGRPPLIPGHFASPEAPPDRGIVFDPFDITANHLSPSQQRPLASEVVAPPSNLVVETDGSPSLATMDPQAMLLAMQQQMMFLQQQLAAAQAISQ